MSLSKLCTPIALATLVACALSCGAHSFAAAQAPEADPAPAAPPPTAAPAPAAAPPPPAAPAPSAAPAAPPAPAPAPAPQPYPQQAYPQQAYPQQAYPQQIYPQQYPQQYPQYQAYPQQYPQTVYITQPVKPPAPRPRRTMMIAGLSVLLASYGVAVITGAALLDAPCCKEDVGWALLIPVAGPYIAAGDADDGSGILVLLGTVQVIGVVLTIGGAVQYALTKNAAAAQNSALNLKLRGQRDLSFDVASNSRMMGPTMKLRF